jgi:GPI ethanolamine phosphate transferase 2/3 subunit F
MAPPPLAHVVPHAPSSSPSSRLLTPTTKPIPLLNAPTARLYALVHTALIPSLYLLRSGPLVRDPLPTLTFDLIPLATAQAAFCILCLPAAGTWNNGTKDAGRGIVEGTASATNTPVKSGKASIGRKKGTKAAAHLNDPTIGGYGARIMVSLLYRKSCEVGPRLTNIQPCVFALVLALLVPPVPLQCLLHALGAPLFPYSQLPHTLALATHISLLAFFPIFYTHGVSNDAWRDVAAAWLPFDEAGVWGGTVGTVLGGWFGAIPIALDWDREWQKWPCTVIWGCALGWMVGRALTAGLGVGNGKRIDLSECQSIPRDIAGAEKKKA